MADIKQGLVMRAKIYEQAERYQDMQQMMKEATIAAGSNVELTNEERNLLSVAYKNVVGERRSSWRVISTLLKKCDPDSEKQKVAEECLGKVEKELTDICNDLLELIEKYLIPMASSPDAKVFYLKMKGDYYRYMAEILKDENRKNTVGSAQQAYQAAMDIAQTQMGPTHPIRLGLALNYSVFYYEILEQADKACELAKQAFDQAVSDLETMSEETYKDSSLIMQLLRDNLTLWTSELDEEAEDEEKMEQQETNSKPEDETPQMDGNDQQQQKTENVASGGEAQN